MPVYERVDARGQIVERVDPVPGGYEDTRLGVAALEGTNGWRVAGAEPAAEPTPAPQDPADPDADGGQAAAPAPPTGRRRRT